MRIIIEDAHPAAPGQISGLKEGGAAGLLFEPLAGAASGQPAGGVEELRDAGPPPAWLSESVRKAYEGDPGRFDIQVRPGRGGDAGRGPSDGGGAPQIDLG